MALLVFIVFTLFFVCFVHGGNTSATMLATIKQEFSDIVEDRINKLTQEAIELREQVNLELAEYRQKTDGPGCYKNVPRTYLDKQHTLDQKECEIKDLRVARDKIQQLLGLTSDQQDASNKYVLECLEYRTVNSTITESPADPADAQLLEWFYSTVDSNPLVSSINVNGTKNANDPSFVTSKPSELTDIISEEIAMKATMRFLSQPENIDRMLWLLNEESLENGGIAFKPCVMSENPNTEGVAGILAFMTKIEED